MYCLWASWAHQPPTVHDINPAELSPPIQPFSKPPVPIRAPAPLPLTDDPDYVWDVFYHLAGLADDYEEMPNANIGTLCVRPWGSGTLAGLISHARTGLPASFDDPYSSDEDTEPEDEADEDSNGVLTIYFLRGHYTQEPKRRNTIKTTIPTKIAMAWTSRMTQVVRVIPAFEQILELRWPTQICSMNTLIRTMHGMVGSLAPT